ncbi:hypothetical protein D3C84_1038710 [compost metagenome]
MLETFPDDLGGVRPGAVGVRVVALPGNHVFIHELQVLQTEVILDEAGDEVLPEDIAGHLPAEIRVGPRTVVAMGEVGALQQVGNPADTAFGQGHA